MRALRCILVASLCVLGACKGRSSCGFALSDGNEDEDRDIVLLGDRYDGPAFSELGEHLWALEIAKPGGVAADGTHILRERKEGAAHAERASTRMDEVEVELAEDLLVGDGRDRWRHETCEQQTQQK